MVFPPCLDLSITFLPVTPQRNFVALFAQEFAQGRAPTPGANDPYSPAHGQSSMKAKCKMKILNFSSCNLHFSLWVWDFTLLFLLSQPGQRDHPFTAFEINKAHPLGISPDHANVLDSKTNDFSVVGHQH